MATTDNRELRALYSFSDIGGNLKSQTLRWEGHAAEMDESRAAFNILVESLKRKGQTIGQDEDGRTISEQTWLNRCNNVHEWIDPAQNRNR